MQTKFVAFELVKLIKVRNLFKIAYTVNRKYFWN